MKALESITTARLTLRLMQSTDSAFIIELLNEPDFIENIGDKQVRTTADAINYMETGPLACQIKNGFCLMVVCLTSGEPIGLCGLLKRETLPAPDLGYAFLERHYRKGYALESCTAILQHFKAIRPIYAITNQANVASQNLLVKLGFVLVDAKNEDERVTQYIKQ